MSVFLVVFGNQEQDLLQPSTSPNCNSFFFLDSEKSGSHYTQYIICLVLKYSQNCFRMINLHIHEK